MRLLFSTIILALGFGIPAAHAAKKSPLLEVKKKMLGGYHSGGLPEGFTDKLLTKKTRPKFTRDFLKYLANLEKEKKKLWEVYVSENHDEFGQKTPEEIKAIAEDPYGELGQRYLVEIGEVYAIYKDGELVGYAFDTADHVQATIYQDGAGINIYTDANLKVVATQDWSS